MDPPGRRKKHQLTFHLYGMKLLFASKQISMAGEDSATEQTFICTDRQDTFPPQHTLTIL